MNNAYFEGQLRNYVDTQTDEQVVERLKVVEGVENSLRSSEGWQVLLKDAERWKGLVDDNWQDVYEDNKLLQMRVVKQAYKFILEIPYRYQKEKEILKEELASRLDTRKTEDEI